MRLLWEDYIRLQELRQYVFLKKWLKWLKE